MLAQERAGHRREPTTDTAEHPIRESSDPSENVQFAQVVKYRVEHRHSKQRQQQTQRLSADHEHTDRTVRARARARRNNERDHTGELLHRIMPGRSILVVEHDMVFVRQFASIVTVLHMGAVLCEGPVEQVQNDPQVIEVYIGRSKAKVAA